MLEENPYLSKHLRYLSEINTQSAEQLIYKVLNLDKDEQELLQRMRNESGSMNCGQQIIPKEYYIRCHDCGISQNHLICQPCFDENLHQNHFIQLLKYDNDSGYCDCGDPNEIKAEGFCKSHSIKTIQRMSNNQEQQLLGKLKILLEISCYNSIRLLEQTAMLPIIQADENVIQTSQSLKLISQSQQNAYHAYEKMNTIILYLTGSNPKLIELVCQVFTSQVPLQLQNIQQFQHNHLPIFNIGMVFENKFNYCSCSVWKNLLRYIIFFNKEFQQELFIERYLPHLLIDHYAEVITKTFVEMIPFSMQMFTKAKFYWEKFNKDFSLYIPIHYNEGLNSYLQSQEIKDQNCPQKLTKVVQLKSKIFDICYQLQQRIIQSFQFHKEQVEYAGWFIEQGNLKSKRFSKILSKLRHYLFGQLRKSKFLYCLDEIFLNDPIDSYAFRTIINLVPCKPYQQHQTPNLQYQDNHIFRLILNQCHIILLFEQIFRGLIEYCKDKDQKLYITRIILQHLIKKLIQTYPKNYENQYNLGKLQFIFAQFVPADHVMIILLSFYYQLRPVEKGDQFIQIILEDFQLNNHQLEQLFKNLVQRSIQNLVLINDSQQYNYYCRKLVSFILKNDISKLYDTDNSSEFSQESLDRANVQMYFFLYGEKAIVAAYNYVEFINNNFQTNFSKDRFLNYALSSDFDMYQTCSHYFMEELPQDFKAAQRKVIKSLFYAQNYFSYNQILDNLNQMGNYQLNMLNQNNLLEILELESYSGQLRLKKQYQPPLFEPLFFNYQAIFEQIQDKLNENNNQEVKLFGSSIEYDFSCTDENSKTLSGIRKHIIDQLLKGQNIMATIVLGQLYSQTDENIKINIIESNKQLIYLFIIASKYLKLPEQNQYVLQNLFDIIQEISIQNDIIDILRLKIIGNNQIDQFKQHYNKNNNKKILKMKQKFKQKQQLFENNIGEDGFINNEYDPNLVCNLCALYIEEKQDYYSLAMFQLNNNIIYYSEFKDQQYLKYLEQFSPSISELTLTGCTHIYHIECIKKLGVFEINEESFYQCRVCKSLGNKMFPASNFNSQAIFQDIEYFTILSRTDMLKYYQETYYVNGQLDIKSLNSEIILQIYLYYIRQIICNKSFYESTDNIQKFKQLTLLIKSQMDLQIQNQYFSIINKYSQSVIFQILKQIIDHGFNIETQQFSVEIYQILSNFELLDQHHQQTFMKLFIYWPQNQQFLNLKSIIVQKVEQFTNLRDLQKRLIEKCINCQKLSQYLCIGCHQKVCIGFQVIIDYKKSCCYHHSLKCHKGNVNILDVQTGIGYVAYQQEIALYQKSLFKTKLGQQYSGDIQNSIKYLADPIALEEFYHIQIHNKQMIYIIKNKK